VSGPRTTGCNVPVIGSIPLLATALSTVGLVNESTRILDWLPPAGFKILLALFLSFLVGLEREEHTADEAHRGFGGVRTFPIIGLIGYAMALLAGDQLWPVAVGFLAISAFLLLFYWHKLITSTIVGVTSEMAALITYLIGALVSHDQFWIATTLTVATMILLALKTVLENLAKRVAPEDVFTFTKFLLLTAVILPIVPNEEFTQYRINPFKGWLVVVAVSALSYGSYVVQKLTKARGRLLLAALLGGAYSSTVTTVVLAKRAPRDAQTYRVSGAILIASGVMYLRLAVLLALFNRELMSRLAPIFVLLAAGALCVGWLWSRRDPSSPEKSGSDQTPTNPLELRAALLFSLLFLATLIASHIAVEYLGKSGVFTLAAIMGATDVDPFILSMTQAQPGSTASGFATSAILIAAASNNVVKGVYAYVLSPRGTGGKSLRLLLGLAAAGVAPLIW
jgi:uncharacterized membrane protein (DUF4010 family)